MKKIILALMVISIALIGVCTVSASSDVDTLNYSNDDGSLDVDAPALGHEVATSDNHVVATNSDDNDHVVIANSDDESLQAHNTLQAHKLNSFNDDKHPRQFLSDDCILGNVHFKLSSFNDDKHPRQFLSDDCILGNVHFKLSSFNDDKHPRQF